MRRHQVWYRLSGQPEAAAPPPPLPIRGVLPGVGQTRAFIRRLYETVANRFDWLNADLEPPPLAALTRMPPPISGESVVPTTLAGPPGVAGFPVAQEPLYRRRRH